MICEWCTWNLKEKIRTFQLTLLGCSSNAKPYNSVSWEQNGYYAAQNFCVYQRRTWDEFKSFERSPRKSTHRASRELRIPQPTVWRVLRRRLLFNWVHLFESHIILNWAHQQCNGSLHVVNYIPVQPIDKIMHTCQHKWHIPTSMEHEITVL